jgi:hypothetical protein
MLTAAAVALVRRSHAKPWGEAPGAGYRGLVTFLSWRALTPCGLCLPRLLWGWEPNFHTLWGTSAAYDDTLLGFYPVYIFLLAARVSHSANRVLIANFYGGVPLSGASGDCSVTQPTSPLRSALSFWH